jgi:NAD-dependent DNA ligase
MQEQIAKPAASKFLEGFVVLFCGIDEDRRAKAKEAVARYGGKCVDKYNNTVTCGIVGRVGSSGFKDMLNAKVRLLTFKWLQDCMLSRSLAPMEQPQYKVNIFTGLNVVCTQLNQDERTRIQQLVESGGGTYSDKLFGNICTHLIAKTPDGEKYMGAKKFGTVKIVVMAWAEECVKQKGANAGIKSSLCLQSYCLLLHTFAPQCGCQNWSTRWISSPARR